MTIGAELPPEWRPNSGRAHPDEIALALQRAVAGWAAEGDVARLRRELLALVLALEAR